MTVRKVRVRHANTKQLDKGEEEHTIKSFVLTQLNKFFVQHLPMESLKEFPPSYMYYVGTVVYMAMIATFIYFTYQSYISSVKQAFIALDPSSGDCSSVPIAISNTYLADSRGNWVGTPEFVYSLSLYSLTLNNFQVNSFSEYQTMMYTFNDELERIGAISEHHSLAYNLILWSSWIRYYSTTNPRLFNFTSQGLGQLQFIQMTGEPAVIFDGDRHQTVVSSQYGLCPVVGATTYDLANAQLSTQVNYTSYRSELKCILALEPQLFGYTPAVDNNVFVFGLDVDSFVTAMAVNYGILHIRDLGLASQKVYDFEFNGIPYVGQQYFDIRFPYMTPILCVRNSSSLPPASGILAQRLCFIVDDEAVTLPIYNHFGLSYRYPIPCRCGASNKFVGESPPCQVFNMLASLVFFLPLKPPTSLNGLLIEQIQKLLTVATGFRDYSSFLHESFNATWSAAANAYGRQDDSTLSPTWQSDAFAFCKLPSGQRCSMVTFNSYNAINRIVSEYKFQLQNGSCSNTFTIPLTDWQKLVDAAPVELTQHYYDCYPSATSALLNAFGIASGNTQLVVPLTVLATIPLVYIFLVIIQRVPPKEEYTNEEKMEVMEIVSIILLRLRDGKSRGIRKDGVLMKLTKELIKAAKEEVGYPDSDDDEEKGSDDEEDESGDEDDQEEGEEEGDINGEDAEKGLRASRQLTTIDSDDEIEENTKAAGGETVAKSSSKNTSTGNNSDKKTGKSAKKKSKSSVKRKTKRDSYIPPNYDTWNDTKPKKVSKLSVFTRQLEVEEDNQGSGAQRTGANVDDGDEKAYYPGKYLVSAARVMRDNVQKQAHQTLASQKYRRKSNINHLEDSDDEDQKQHTGAKKREVKEEDRYSTSHGTEMTVMSDNQTVLDQSDFSRGSNRHHESSQSNNNPMHHSPGMHKVPRLVFRIINQEGIPQDCMILNALDRSQVQSISRKPIKDLKQLMQVVEDLSKQANLTFTDYEANPRIYEASEDLRRPDTTLFQLTSLSMRLLFVEFDFFLSLSAPASASSSVSVEESTMIFLKLSNVMRLHASALLQLSLKEMEEFNSVGKIGYNIGGRYVTLPHLVQIMSSLSE